MKAQEKLILFSMHSSTHQSNGLDNSEWKSLKSRFEDQRKCLILNSLSQVTTSKWEWEERSAHTSHSPSAAWTEALLILPSLKMGKAKQGTHRFVDVLNNIRKNHFRCRAQGPIGGWSCGEAASSHKLTCHLLKGLVCQWGG